MYALYEVAAYMGGMMKSHGYCLYQENATKVHKKRHVHKKKVRLSAPAGEVPASPACGRYQMAGIS